MPRSADVPAAGRAGVLALPAAVVAVLATASPAAAHDGHAGATGPAWLPVVAAVVGGWFVAAPDRERSTASVVAGVLLMVGPSWPDPWRGLHVAGAGLWAGAVLQVLRRPSRAALRAAAPTAVTGAGLACATGLLMAL